MMVTASKRQYETIWKRIFTEKNPLGSHIHERDEVNQECINTKMMTNKEDEEVAQHIKKCKDSTQTNPNSKASPS